MTTTLWILFALFWLLQPILCYGWTYGYFQRKFHPIAPEHEDSDKQIACVFALAAIPFGPVLTFIVFFLSEGAKHGLKFR